MIISGGSNIYPREVEEVLLQHPDVVECSVIGSPHPDWGEETVAFVVLREGAPFQPQVLDELCLQQIARFKRPKRYHLLTALPKNNYGKILKTELRKMLVAMGEAGKLALCESACHLLGRIARLFPLSELMMPQPIQLTLGQRPTGTRYIFP